MQTRIVSYTSRSLIHTHWKSSCWVSKMDCRLTGNQFALLFPLPTNVNNYYHMLSVKCTSYGCICSTKSCSVFTWSLVNIFWPMPKEIPCLITAPKITHFEKNSIYIYLFSAFQSSFTEKCMSTLQIRVIWVTFYS